MVVWLVANSAAVTPTNAAATKAIAAIARMIFVFILFSPQPIQWAASGLDVD